MWLDPYRAFSSDGPELTALQVVLPPTYFCPVHAGPPPGPRLDLPTDVLGRPRLGWAARRGRWSAAPPTARPPPARLMPVIPPLRRLWADTNGR